MKKKNVKSLRLKKEKISSFDSASIRGGSGNCGFQFPSFDNECDWSQGFDDLKNVAKTSDECY